MTPVFLFGTLLDDALRETVAGRALNGRAAQLPGHRIERAAAGDYPVLVAGGDGAGGLLFEVDDTTLARLDFYEAGFDYVRAARQVVQDGAPVTAQVYVAATPQEPSGAGWSLSDWARDWGALTRLAAVEVMAGFGAIGGDELRFRMTTIRQRALARLRAAEAPAPRSLRSDIHRDAVEVIDARAPYVHFFSVAEIDLTHPRHDGGRSAPINRGALVSGDAVTVLPYDPATDRVLVIDQFRFAPFVRGDLYPWVLEPIAGRIDPGETAADAARREAREEARVEIGAMHRVAGYYPSPGVLTEYLESFVGIADLSDAADRLAGRADENEDIRAHVIPFARLMDLVESGEADTSPLLLSALWLERARNRGTLA
ncbi:NUDIX domain-containing protein [Palleronia sediminis]|uniref:ADP-ribose pyrophosphatase n=1 Tax=Palleronia sediminis TaxID=2547833 RepID=A0A4R6AJC1_9RHOB|nr:gamma-glutamylcyclotransferase [Palleronia sediminis]TDL84070.1 NUDIX domain-containing protein [Palleronia sediminis]